MIIKVLVPILFNKDKPERVFYRDDVVKVNDEERARNMLSLSYAAEVKVESEEELIEFDPIEDKEDLEAIELIEDKGKETDKRKSKSSK